MSEKNLRKKENQHLYENIQITMKNLHKMGTSSFSINKYMLIH